jgi:flagellar hook protein FlgE
VRIDFENALPPKQTDEVNLAGNLNANTSTAQIVQAQSAFTDSSGNIAAGTTDINDLSQTTSDLEAGDVIEVTYTQNDGTAGATADFEYGTDGTTLDDMVAALNTDLGAQGDLALVDGMLQLKSGSLGDSELNIDSTNVIDNAGDADAVNFPGFQVTQEGETNTQTMSTTVYDDLGKGHSLLIDFTQVAENEWEYEAEFADGETINSGSTGTVTFDEMGQVTSGGNFNMEFEPGNGAGTTNFDVELGDSSQGTTFTQYSGANTAKVVSQDGYSQGSLVDISIDGDGRLQGVYDNGQNKDLAQLALGNVQNEDGLEMVGGGLFRATSAAGEVFIDSADNLSDSSINSGALEGSNVELAQEFTEMITSQRAYQSSARVISTSDEMLTEAVNLKR